MGTGDTDHQQPLHPFGKVHSSLGTDPLHHALSEDTPNIEETGNIGPELHHVLERECNGQLSGIEWFKTTWQTSGAMTGFAKWRFDDGSIVDAMVKLPVGHREKFWMETLNHPAPEQWDAPDVIARPTPRMLAAGDTLDGNDIAWLVMERFHDRPLSHHITKPHVAQLLRAATVFHCRTIGVHELTEPPEEPDWAEIVERARDQVAQGNVPDERDWARLLKDLSTHLPKLVSVWHDRPIDTWCHGDLHPGNAFVRTLSDTPSGSEPNECCVLIDLAMVHAGCWIEDAVYLDRQRWGTHGALFGVRPVKKLAKLRREAGLPVEGRWQLLADVRRVLMAGTSPAFLHQTGHPEYLAKARSVLSELLDDVVRQI